MCVTFTIERLKMNGSVTLTNEYRSRFQTDVIRTDQSAETIALFVLLKLPRTCSGLCVEACLWNSYK